MNDIHSVDDLLNQIRPQLQKMPDFGQIQIHIKRHSGTFSNTDIVQFTTHRYTDNEPNVTCTTDIYQLIKNIAAANLTGTLGFGISFKKGRADTMQVQDFEKL